MLIENQQFNTWYIYCIIVTLQSTFKWGLLFERLVWSLQLNCTCVCCFFPFAFHLNTYLLAWLLHRLLIMYWCCLQVCLSCQISYTSTYLSSNNVNPLLGTFARQAAGILVHVKLKIKKGGCNQYTRAKKHENIGKAIPMRFVFGHLWLWLSSNPSISFHVFCCYF